MKRHLPALMIALATTTLAVGCGSSKDAAPTATTSTPTTTARGADPRIALTRSARAALRANDRLSGYVLWHNKVPAWAQQSTRGPALAALRTAAGDRRARRIRVRTLADRIEIVSLTINPAYTRAHATVRSAQRLRPYRDDQALGRAIVINEKVRVELHRLPRSERFVVWHVVALP
jgi:hypothetical protein